MKVEAEMENCELHRIFDYLVRKNTGLLPLFSIHENKISEYLLRVEAACSRKGSKQEAIKTASEKFQEL